MHRLAKSKLAWIALAYVCILVVVLVFAINVEHYECTREDIISSDKVVGVDEAMHWNNLTMTDKIELTLYFDQKPSRDEIHYIEELGVTIHENTWIPPVDQHPYGFYFADCRIEDVCKLIDLELVKRIEWADDELELLNESQ